MRLLDGEEARILCGILAEGQRCDVTLGEIRTHYIAVRRQEAADIIRDGIAGGVFRAALFKAVERALMPDPARPRIMGVTPAGLLEITRPRRTPPLEEILNSAQDGP